VGEGEHPLRRKLFSAPSGEDRLQRCRRLGLRVKILLFSLLCAFLFPGVFAARFRVFRPSGASSSAPSSGILRRFSRMILLNGTLTSSYHQPGASAPRSVSVARSERKRSLVLMNSFFMLAFSP
jgi:dolichol kinase